MLSDAQLEQALHVLGDLLQDQGEHYEIVLIGGGALLVLGLIERATQDLDVVALVEGDHWSSSRPFPPSLTEAVRVVGEALQLESSWLNPGPADIMEHGLPEGFQSRALVRRYGGLTVHFAGRADQVAFKLDAAADHFWRDPDSKHMADLRTLQPTAAELEDARAWCLSRRHPSRVREIKEIFTMLLMGWS